MKNFRTLRATLFDSTNASFKLNVEAQFVRGNQQEGYKNLVYITNAGTGMLNPNIYLTLSNKDNDATPVYTSYPQLFRLREAFETIKSYIVDKKGYIDVDGQISVNSQYGEPVIISNIGKGNNWISLKLTVLETDEGGIKHSFPGVTIQLSTSSNEVSNLSVDEFLTVYTIIRDLDLSAMQVNMSLAFLSADQSVPQYQQNAYTPTQYANQYQQQTIVPPYQQPRYQGQTQVYSQPRQSYQQPQYNQNNGYKSRYNSAPRATNPVIQQQPQIPQETTPMMAPKPNTNQMPPRSEGKPVINFKSVEETPVSEVNYDDSAAFDALFNDNN